MCAMAVGTDWGVEVPLAKLGIMDAIKGLGIFIKMAASTRVCVRNGEFTNAFETSLGVIGRRKTEMAVEAAQFGMHRRI